jgi:signal transduction histidine kinase
VDLLLHNPELDDALRLTLHALRGILPESTIAVYRYWEKFGELEVVAVEPIEEAEALVGTRLPLDGWRPGEAVRTGQALHLPSVTLRVGFPTVDLLCAPVLGVNHNVLGVLQAASTRPNSYSDSDLHTLRAVASLIGLAEENVQRGEALQAATISRLYAEYIAAMADMTSHITHRVVNEVGAIRLAVQVIRMRHERGQLDAAELIDKLDAIQQNTDNAIALVRSVRRPFDRIETMPTQISSMLDSVLDKSVPPDIVVIRQEALDLPAVMATQHLAEVFNHLVGNALEAMSEVEYKCLTIVAHCINDTFVEVVVEDTGTGVSEALEDGLFALGISGDRDRLGYGLWWSRLYLTRIGGGLELDPNVRKGARFVVRLRIAPPYDGPAS